MGYVLEMSNISKIFPGVHALNNVNFRVRKGSIHALMGENGAGKSTLMKLLIGVYTPDYGNIRFKDKEVFIDTPHKALQLGISMIHQELSPVPYMTIAENIWLGREACNRAGFINYKLIKTETQKLLQNLGLNLDPDELMVNLSVANRQMVEIAKAISYDAELIIMDEATSAITEREIERLFKIINSLKEKGVTVIYITHRMEEVFILADEITVLRDGHFIGTYNTKAITKKELIGAMVGRELTQIFPHTHTAIPEIKLSVKNLSLKGFFHNISFDVKKGEIFGIAGLVGAGRTEIVETIYGIRKKDMGEIFIDGKEIEINHPKDAVKSGMALLTEDRKGSGLFLMLSVLENIEIANIGNYIKKIFLNRKKIFSDCTDLTARLKIKTPSLYQTVKNLSGGNQQKTLIARWLLTNPDILILDEPTRGIDVGAKAEIHALMDELAKAGKAIIMISSEMPEILGMSDRILVMHEGKMSGILDKKEATQETVLALASGEKLHDHAGDFI